MKLKNFIQQFISITSIIFFAQITWAGVAGEQGQQTNFEGQCESGKPEAYYPDLDDAIKNQMDNDKYLIDACQAANDNASLKGAIQFRSCISGLNGNDMINRAAIQSCGGLTVTGSNLDAAHKCTQAIQNYEGRSIYNIERAILCRSEEAEKMQKAAQSMIDKYGYRNSQKVSQALQGADTTAGAGNTKKSLLGNIDKKSALIGAAGVAGLGILKDMLGKKDKDKDDAAAQAAAGGPNPENFGVKTSETGETCLTHQDKIVENYCYSQAQLQQLCTEPDTVNANVAFGVTQGEDPAAASTKILKDNVCSSMAVADGENGECNTSALNAHQDPDCYTNFIGNCMASAGAPGCSEFQAHYCEGESAEGAGGNFCVFQEARDYCQTAVAASPACQWVAQVSSNSACISNILDSACYPQGTQASLTNQCNLLNVANTDPVCKNLSTDSFYTAFRNPGMPSNDSENIDCSLPGNFQQSSCMTQFCAKPGNAASPSCSDVSATAANSDLSTSVQATEEPPRSEVSYGYSGSVTLSSVQLPADISASSQDLWSYSDHSTSQRMCDAGQLYDCGPLVGYIPE